MPTVDSDLKKRAVRNKLTKRPKQMNRLPSYQVPERLRHGDDAQEDAAAPARGANTVAPQYLNQSIFSMIAAAGSNTNFNKRFEDSSDSEPEDESSATSSTVPTPKPQDLGQSYPLAEVNPKIQKELETKGRKEERHARKKSENRLLQSLPKLNLRTSRKGTPTGSHEKEKSEAAEPELMNAGLLTSPDAPVMSRMIEAQAQFDASSSEAVQESNNLAKRGRTNSSPDTLLAIRLMEIFGFEEPEKVLSEYPCWLMKTVFLQGYLYITTKHICFYAYLPKKSNVIARSGYLAKRGKQNPKYNRYWFTLKGDVLSYYANPADLYFPSGNIDLRYAISAGLVDSSKDAKDFCVATDYRTYYFRADSSTSAKEWVKTLQKVIFRSHNDGDSVKISLPIDNVLDLEENTVVDFAETITIKVMESGDSYALDEYYFAFFGFGRDALSRLRGLVDDTSAQRLSQDLLSPQDGRASRSQSPAARKSLDRMSPGSRVASSSLLKDSVRATLMPHSPADSGRSSPRPSGEWGRSSREWGRSSRDLMRPDLDSNVYGRASFDRGRRSGSTSRLTMQSRPVGKSPAPKQQSSSDSYVQSVEQETESSLVLNSATDTRDSASQILERSDVFHSPTINRLRPSPTSSKFRRHSEDTARSFSPRADIKVHPPSRAHTGTDSLKSRPKAMKSPPLGSDPGDSGQLPRSNSLQDILKSGSFPLQRAAGFAGYLKNTSKRMSNLLATESMGYLEKVSGMWQGGRRHYGENEDVLPDNGMLDPEDVEASVGHGDRFRTHFALPKSEKLQATYFGYLNRVLPLYGKIYVSDRKFCFRSLLPGTRTKMILPLKDIETVHKEKGFRFGYHGLVLVIKGYEELFFEFNNADSRDDCAVTLHESLENVKSLLESGLLAAEEQEDADVAKAENELLQEARRDGQTAHDLELPTSIKSEVAEIGPETPPILFDDPRASIINFKPTESLRVTCLTIGSRGDVQPYIALCKGLLAEGHKPKIATHAEFGPWVRKHGIDFQPVEGDPAELMRICVENGMFTYSFLKEASVKFRGWIDDLLTSAWKACQDTDILIESPSAMAGIHIAEALGIPYFRAFTMPWTRTRAYPHAFAVPDHRIGGAYNWFTYVMFDNIFWKAIAGQVNRWRKKELGLRSTNLDKMQPNKVPFLYNFSPHVVIPPLDYSDWVRVTGYWFLDEGDVNKWEAPEELTAFIKNARADGKKLVYIGFGSIVVSDPAALTRTVVDSVLKADVRCILSKGWSDRLGDPSSVKAEIALPSDILQIKSAPHDWLFQQIDAAVHHGGAGTTGASLRAGLPTIIKPFFGDQFFFGGRIEDLGVGICLKKINVAVFARALWEAVHSERMIVKARVLGEQIRKENGVETAIQAIYRDLEYAKTLIKARRAVQLQQQSQSLADPKNPADRTGNPPTAADDNDEESWTFIGDESDPELQRQIKNFNPNHVTGAAGATRLSGRGVRAVESVEARPSAAGYGERMRSGRRKSGNGIIKAEK
ncbi:MAG: hypothetical protein Q9227_004019 [Pyrenula ochraceoflavens]